MEGGLIDVQQFSLKALVSETPLGQSHGFWFQHFQDSISPLSMLDNENQSEIIISLDHIHDYGHMHAKLGVICDFQILSMR